MENTEKHSCFSKKPTRKLRPLPLNLNVPKYTFREQERKPDYCLVIPFLFLGNFCAYDEMKLNGEVPDIIINITKDIYSPYDYTEVELDDQIKLYDSKTYFRVPIDDNYCEEIEKYFDKVVELIDYQVKNKKKVLIHCRAGLSRSVCFVVCYLVKKRGYTFSEAYKQLIEQRGGDVFPNICFYMKVKDYLGV